MAAQWHYGQGEEQHGPVALEELKQLVASGQVKRTDMVWNADMPDWLPAGDVAELFPKQDSTNEPAAVEPLPSVSPKQPSEADPASRGRLRPAVIGVVAFCVVVIPLIYFLTRHKPDDLPEEVRLALTTVKTNPTDPEANLVVGKYRCFQQGDWDKEGLWGLIKGSDVALKELATAEMRKPKSSEEQKKLGDGWWDLAGNTAGLVWKGSQQRAVYWYKKAVAADPSMKTDLEQRIATVGHLPDGFMVVARRADSHPDKDSYETKCAHLSVEVTKTGKEDPQKPHTLGSGIAGLELKGVRLLELKVKSSPDLEGANEEKKNNKNIIAGFIVDYQTAEGYAKRVALCLTAFSKERDVKAPGWGKKSVPDDYVDLGKKDSYQLDLQKWAPPGWTGQVWFGVVLQQIKPNTYLKAELLPQAASQATGNPK